ncbi:hypothetical protein KO465_08510 [Candidatus Micrarchaeota archaeon]|nr:hypothetical protein [Candidatus Micrarchaeota archaeon]
MDNFLSKQRIDELKKQYYYSLKKSTENIKLSDSFYGPTPPNLLIGSYGYPNVKIGSMFSLNSPEYSANPSLMYGKTYSKIITQFGLNMMGIGKSFVKNQLNEDINDSLLSYAPVSMEVDFKYKPLLNPVFSQYTIPSGFSAPLKRIKLIDNPKIPRVTYSVLNDDLLANESVMKISLKTDVYYTTRLMSAGILGKEKNRRLVPSRWAITSVDDIIVKNNLTEIREFKQIDKYEVYVNEFLHNRFVIVLIPGPWEYEQFEAWPLGSPWHGDNWGFNHEYEPFKGRKKYASSQAGGYYAARYGVVEHLYLRRKQAKAIVFREIDSEYSIPVGVWQVRENVRRAMQNMPAVFDKLNEVIEYIKPLLKVDLNKYLKKDEILKQKKLFDFN